MQSDYLNNNSVFDDTKFEKMDVKEILKDILGQFGTSISKEDFKKELENINKIDVNKIGELLKDHIETIINDGMVEIKQYIFTEVVKTNKNGTIDVKKPKDIDLDYSWTEIPNPTIFRYLKKGDRVLLGCSKRNQKSSCWVEFADISSKEISQKTILKDINKIFDLSSNIDLLQYWIEKIDAELS